jgi:hypothetical protein
MTGMSRLPVQKIGGGDRILQGLAQGADLLCGVLCLFHLFTHRRQRLAVARDSSMAVSSTTAAASPGSAQARDDAARTPVRRQQVQAEPAAAGPSRQQSTPSSATELAASLARSARAARGDDQLDRRLRAAASRSPRR